MDVWSRMILTLWKQYSYLFNILVTQHCINEKAHGIYELL